MYRGIEEKSAMNHWFEWAGESPEMEKLYYKVYQLIEDMIKELLPQLLKEYSHMIDIELIGAINNHKIDLSGLEKAVADYLNQYFHKS